MTFEIHHKEITESTNIDARIGKHGDVFTADLQTSGRGRLDHKWHSAAGENLMMSVVLGVEGVAPEQVATLPLVVGLAVHATVKHFMKPEYATGDVLIKWPNDVLVGGRKISGILCERAGDNVIAGIGMNVKQMLFPDEIVSRAISLALIGADAEVNDVRDVLLNELCAFYEQWREGGFRALHSRYSAVDALKGCMVSVLQTDDDSEPVSGVCDGVQADGTLSIAGKKVFAGEAHVKSFRS